MKFSAKLYLLKNKVYKPKFPLAFDDYMERDQIDSYQIAIKYVLAWSQILAQLHHYCIMVYNIPSDLASLLDLKVKPTTHIFTYPREIKLYGALTTEGYRRITNYIMADDCLAFLEFVVYHQFPIPNRRWYLDNFKPEHEDIIKNQHHFQTLNDDEYIVKLRTEFENLKTN